MFIPPGDLPNPGIKPRFPARQEDPLPSELPGKPKIHYNDSQYSSSMEDHWNCLKVGTTASSLRYKIMVSVTFTW